MESLVLGDLLEGVDTKIFQIVIHMILVGAVFLWVKDMSSRVMNYFKLKMSDFGRGTKVIVDGHEGYIHHVGFSEVEITIDEHSTLLMPLERFMKASKVIKTTNGRKGKI